MLWSPKVLTQSISKNFREFWNEEAALSPASRKGSRLPVIFIIGGVLVVILQGILTFPQLLVRAPYEEWDEVVSHNATLPMSIESRFRAPTYGTLEDAKFSVAHWIYKNFDSGARKVPPGVYANSLPLSWQDGWLLVGPKFWGAEATIDYNYARGIYDRRPFFYARLINLVSTYVLLVTILAFCVRLFRSAFWLAFLPILIFTVTPPWLYQLSACLPNNINALLSILIFLLLIEYVILRRQYAFYSAAVLCAVGINFKIDFFVMGLPLAASWMAVSAGSLKEWRGGLKTLAAGLTFFSVTLLATNHLLLLYPGKWWALQMSFAAALQGNPADAKENVMLFFAFLRDEVLSLGSPPGSRGMAAACLAALSIFFLPGVILVQRHLRPTRKITLFFLSLLPLLVLWGFPILRSNPMYGRYLLNGLGVAVTAFGTGLALLACRQGKAGNVLALAIGVFLAGFYGNHLWKVAERFQRFYGEVYNSELGFDMRITRNQAMDFLIKAYQEGDTAPTVLLDQHALFDLRALVKHDIPFRLVNSHNLEDTLRQIDSAGKPVLALFANAQYEPPAVWFPRWSPENEAAYNAYREFFLRQSAIFHAGNRPVSLLSWDPPEHDTEVYVVKIMPPSAQVPMIP